MESYMLQTLEDEITYNIYIDTINLTQFGKMVGTNPVICTHHCLRIISYHHALPWSLSSSGKCKHNHTKTRVSQNRTIAPAQVSARRRQLFYEHRRILALAVKLQRSALAVVCPFQQLPARWDVIILQHMTEQNVKVDQYTL